MDCGSCLRDNALAAALLARGHDVLLAPVYTPTTTDEKNVSDPHVFFGGVSVFLEQHFPMFRHTPALFDRIWDSTAVLKVASKNKSRSIRPRSASMTVSMLKGLAGHQRKEVLKMLRWLKDAPRSMRSPSLLPAHRACPTASRRAQGAGGLHGPG